MSNSRIHDLTALPILLLAVLTVAVSRVEAQADEVLKLDIPTQEAGSALVALARNAGVQIAFADEAGTYVEVNGLRGEYGLEEALASLLADTGLEYKFAAENLILIQDVEQAEESEDPVEAPAEDPVEAPAEDPDEPLELSEQRVTGSRLPGGDPSAQVFSFTAEEISRRGVSSLEDFFRTLPWHFSTINTQTGMFGSEHGSRGDNITFRGEVDVGVATVNLRALGSKNTLVLRDGRRIAGVGGVQQDIVNLLDVPLSTIERVDIQLDGASAVYGADAIGGVVNFITRKDYRGLSASFRQEISSTGADTRRASVNGGYGWRNGRLTATLTHGANKPIINTKLGWTSLDLRPMLGVEYDRRELTNGQPGIVCVLHQPEPSPSSRVPRRSCSIPYVPGLPFQRVVYYRLPADHSGENAQISDFSSTFNRRSFLYDEVPPQNGVDGTQYSLRLLIEQEFSADLRAYAGVNWARSDSYREYRRMVFSPFLIPASNAYNPFGAAVMVNYTPSYEFEQGLLPQPHDRSEDESRTINIGFYWKLFGKHELNLDVNRTKSWRESGGYRVDPDPSALDPTAAAFYEALASPDPARALNVFGNGSVQGSSFEEFLHVNYGPVHGVTETRQHNLTLRGPLFGMWGGAATYSIGGEYRESIIHFDNAHRSDIRFDDDWDPLTGSYSRVGVSRPSRETEAYYAESTFPFFGRKNALAGLRSLILTAQVRMDVDYASGSFGGNEFPRLPGRQYYYDVFDNYAELKYIEGLYARHELNPNITRERNSRMSPRLGFRYKPADTLTFRAAWSRSYTPPYWSQRFSNGNESRGPRFDGLDPYSPDGPRTYEWEDNLPTYNQTYAENLEPEYSTHWSGSLDWLPDALPGLRLGLNWSAVDYSNRIRSSYFYIFEYPEIMMADPRIAVRDSDGHLVRVNIRNINIERRYSEMGVASLEYTFNTRIGRFRPAVEYTRYLDDYEQVSSDAPRDSQLGTQRGQDRYRWQFSTSWEWRNLQADVWAYYTPGYLNDRAHRCPLTPFGILEGSLCEGTWLFTREPEYLSLAVPSLTTIDLTLSYTLDNGLRIRVGGRNVLNRSFPPTVNGYNGFVPYDAGRWDARGRVLFIDVNWRL